MASVQWFIGHSNTYYIPDMISPPNILNAISTSLLHFCVLSLLVGYVAGMGIRSGFI